MRKALLAIVGAALAIGASGVGCGGDDTQSSVVSPAAYSKTGESCARTNDCVPGLSCINNRCTAPVDGGNVNPGTGGTTQPGVGGSTQPGVGGTVNPNPDGGVGGTTQVNTNTTPVARLSNLNESCTRTADCAGALICISQVCLQGAVVTPDAGEGGTVVTPPAPRLGARGESCQVAADCNTGLICIPNPGGIYAGTGSVCELASYGITPTGKTCSGECMTAADCCEMPVGISSTYVTCQDVVRGIATESGGDAGAVACVGTVANVSNVSAALSEACFLYVTYCNCAATTWACTNNQCQYKPTGTQCEAPVAGGSTGGLVNHWNGCPSKTRLGTATWNYPCNEKGQCAPAPVDSACNVDADCNPTSTLSKFVADYPTDTCSQDECTCYNKQGCYRKCAKDLDCADNWKCNTTSKLCVPGPSECTTNAHCADIHGSVSWECTANGTCQQKCASDYECSSSGANRNLGSFSAVCGADKYCHEVGCTADSDCWPSDGGHAKKFCVAPPAAPAGTGIKSALVTGK